MVVVDSSVWIDYFNGKSTWQTDKLDGYLSLVCYLINFVYRIDFFQEYFLSVNSVHTFHVVCFQIARNMEKIHYLIQSEWHQKQDSVIQIFQGEIFMQPLVLVVLVGMVGGVLVAVQASLAGAA